MCVCGFYASRGGGRESKGWGMECNGPWRLTPSMPFFSFLKQNLQLISLHCKDRPQFAEGTPQNIYWRPDAKALIKNMCSSKDPSERHLGRDSIKTLQTAHFHHIAEELFALLNYMKWQTTHFSSIKMSVFGKQPCKGDTAENVVMEYLGNSTTLWQICRVSLA